MSEFEALHTELIAFRGDMDQRFTAIRSAIWISVSPRSNISVSQRWTGDSPRWT